MCARKLALSRAIFFAVLTCALPAAAEPLRIDASAERMRVDGALHEWRAARFSELGSGADASLRYAFATADRGLYLAAEVRDERLVTGDRGDALLLTLAMPDGQRFQVSELWLQAGEQGRSRAQAKIGVGGGPKRPARGVQVVEAALDDGAGYRLEAFVPWALIAGAEIWEQGRGSLTMVDVDGKGAVQTLASASGRSAGELPRLAAGLGQSDLLGSFLQDQQLVGVEPRYDFRAHVAGDARPERVAIVDRFVVVYGPGYRGGESYGYFALPYGLGGSLLRAELLDLTADGRMELVATIRQQNELGARQVWVVLALDETTMVPLFEAELRKELKGGFIENGLAVQRSGRGAPRIEQTVGRAQGLDAGTYREESARDAQPILLPWGELEARSYAWDGKAFAQVAERRRPVSLAPVAPLAAGRTSAATEGTSAGAAVSPDEVLALFKRQQKLPASARPSRSLRANLLAGSAPEQIELFGRTLVVLGPELGAGGSYVAYDVPVLDARDLVELQRADVAGDSHDELLLRVRQQLVGAAAIERELLLVLAADAAGKLTRLLTAEVARRQGASAIENRVSVRERALLIEPGVARGWSQANYPFAAEAVAGAAPLLLPWRDRPQRYRLEGTSLVAHSQ